MRLKIHTEPFRLGLKTYRWGIVYRFPFCRYHSLGRRVRA